MGEITILCPRTGRQVSTGLEIDRAHFDRMRNTRYTLNCWLCGGEHVWSKRCGTFVETPLRDNDRQERDDTRPWARASIFLRQSARS